MDIISTCDDVLSLILKTSNNGYCMLVCKKWQTISLSQCVICEDCKQIIKIFDYELWATIKENLSIQSFSL